MLDIEDLVLRVLVVVTVLWAAQVVKDGYKELWQNLLLDWWMMGSGC